MFIFSKIKKSYKNITAKQFMLTGVFMLAFAAAIGGGFMSKQASSAATIRDCSLNSIDYKNLNGGCGAADAKELIADIKSNSPADLDNIYNHFGMSASEYDRFKSTARPGMAYTNGNVVVDGQIVMTDAWSIGRSGFWYSKGYPISGAGTYYKSAHTKVLKQDLPVMVMFDKNGVVEFAAINACGNPTDGNKRKPGAECKSLNSVAVEGKKNTYKFNSEVSTDQYGLAKVVELKYYSTVGNEEPKLIATTSKPGDFTPEIEFKKAAKVTVKVTISLPGKQTKVIENLELCAKNIGVVEEKFFHVCDTLVATSSDNKTFRFTLKTKQSDGVTVKSADFNLDNKTTVTGIKPVDGKIYRDYTFTDYKEHVVTATKVTFVVNNKEVEVVTPKLECQDYATREKTPECKPGIPENDPRCEEKKYCKPGIPEGDKRCDECKPGVPKGDEKCNPPLPKTGAGSVAGLFAGVSAAGAIGHRVYMSRKARRSE